MCITTDQSRVSLHLLQIGENQKKNQKNSVYQVNTTLFPFEQHGKFSVTNLRANATNRRTFGGNSQKSIPPTLQSQAGLREKQTTAYFVWLNIDPPSRKSTITELRQHAAPEAQNFKQISELRITSKKKLTDEKYQILKNNIKTCVDINLSNS